MLKIKRDLVLFATGGLGYGGIELLWRGRTHWAMLIAGGICFMIFLRVAEKFRSSSLLFKASVCAVCVTGVEMLFGIVFNIMLKQRIWDYSNMPLNFMGQICPLYTLFWGILSYLFIPLAEKINKKLQIK